MTARRKLADQFNLRASPRQPRFRALPPTDASDALPDSRAVWRKFPERPSANTPAEAKISVDYGDGAIERTTFGAANWTPRWTFWRFGWPPEGGR